MLPSVSVIIPTLNSEKILDECLRSITSQEYPKSKVEIIIADGGSSDKTIDIAKFYSAKVVQNKLKTGESGKAEGVRSARYDLIALIDSDNILPDKKWLSEMVKPFADKKIFLSEPIRYTYRESDPVLTRYFALLGMNDPICLFAGNYDRNSLITNRWTDLRFPTSDFGKYLKINLNHEPIPTIGANGTLIRTKIMKEAVGNSKYLFDIDIPLKMIRKRGSAQIAKVKVGIIHTFVEDDIFKFFRKQFRRINDMSFHKANNNRETNWENDFMFGILKFVLSCILIFPIIYQTVLGFVRKPDVAWLYHPIVCYSTFFIYVFGWIKGKIFPRESSREKWKQ